jgi:molecular chaperone DnaK
MDKSAIGKVFMVGGPSRMPCVQESVRAFFNKAPTVKEPGDAVAKGAAIFAALRAPKTLLGPLQAKAVGQTSVVDITPHYFGIAIHEQYSTSYHFNRVLIEKGLPVPHSIVKRFCTSEGENKTGIQLIITQCPRSERDISKVKILHNKYVPINPRGNAGDPIEVTFSYDANGMMECVLHEISTGKKTQLNLQAG